MCLLTLLGSFTGRNDRFTYPNFHILLSCTWNLKIGILFGSSLQGRSQDFSKGTHHFPNPSFPPPLPPPPPHNNVFTLYKSSLPLFPSPSLSILVHQWITRRFAGNRHSGVRKKRVSCFRKKYSSETSRVKWFGETCVCVCVFFVFFFSFICLFQIVRFLLYRLLLSGADYGFCC